MLGLGRGRSATPGPPDLKTVCRFLDGMDLRYFVDGQGKTILLSFECDKADYDMFILVDQQHAFVYISLARYLQVPRDHPSFPAILTRLMEINWDLLLGKFEWNPNDGEVRVAFTFTTENGLGQKALGAAISAILDVADKHYIELHALLEP